MSSSPPQRRAAAAVLSSLIAACSSPLSGSPPSILPDATTATEEIREACVLTQRKCTRCHSIDRVLVAPVRSPRDWEVRVARMRRMMASGISEAEGGLIVRCLVHVSFSQ